jgi:hypothetical protein
MTIQHQLIYSFFENFFNLADKVESIKADLPKQQDKLDT